MADNGDNVVRFRRNKDERSLEERCAEIDAIRKHGPYLIGLGVAMQDILSKDEMPELSKFRELAKVVIGQMLNDVSFIEDHIALTEFYAEIAATAEGVGVDLD